jgi:HK97 family phage major capsid protein
MDKNELLKLLKEWKDEMLLKVAGIEGATTEKVNKISETLDSKIKDAVEVYTKSSGVRLGLSANDKQKFSFGSLVRAMATGKWKGAEFEREIIDATIAKSANASSLAAGGVLIPTDIGQEIIALAMPNIVMMEMGVTRYNDLVGDLLLPKITGRPSIYWVDEEEAPTESNVTFGDVKLQMKTAAAFTKISQKLLLQSNEVIDRVVREELGKAFGIGIDGALLTGTGTDKKPAGIYSVSGFSANTVAMGANGKRFTMYEAGLMIKAVELANMLVGNSANFGFLMHPAAKWGMKLERIPQFTTDTAGAYAFNPLITDAMLESMVGYKIRSSTQISATETVGASPTTSSVIFGDFSQIGVGMWGNMEIKTSDIAGNASGSAMLNRQIWITGFQGIDQVVKNATGFTKVAGAETNEALW